MDSGVLRISGTTDTGWSKAGKTKWDSWKTMQTEHKGIKYVFERPPSRRRTRPSSRRRRPPSWGRTLSERDRVVKVIKSKSKVSKMFIIRIIYFEIPHNLLESEMTHTLLVFAPSVRRQSPLIRQGIRLGTNRLKNSHGESFYCRHSAATRALSGLFRNAVLAANSLVVINNPEILLVMDKVKKSKKSQKNVKQRETESDSPAGSSDQFKRKNTSFTDRSDSLNTTKRTREDVLDNGDGVQEQKSINSTMSADRTVVEPPPHLSRAGHSSDQSLDVSGFYSHQPPTSSPNGSRFRQDEISILLESDERLDNDEQKLIDSINEHLDLQGESSGGTVRPQGEGEELSNHGDSENGMTQQFEDELLAESDEELREHRLDKEHAYRLAAPTQRRSIVNVRALPYRTLSVPNRRRVKTSVRNSANIIQAWRTLQAWQSEVRWWHLSIKCQFTWKDIRLESRSSPRPTKIF